VSVTSAFKRHNQVESPSGNLACSGCNHNRVILAFRNANGAFVAPTPETMTSAVSRMEPDASGVLQLDPTVTAPAGQPQPYPLTYVEYAMVPAEPLVDATCTARPDSQARRNARATSPTNT